MRRPRPWRADLGTAQKLQPAKVPGWAPKIVRQGSCTCLFSNRAGLSEFTMPAETPATRGLGRGMERDLAGRRSLPFPLRPGAVSCLNSNGPHICKAGLLALHHIHSVLLLLLPPVWGLAPWLLSQPHAPRSCPLASRQSQNRDVRGLALGIF
jgi:hypothetical protein